jgi:hypothetical protein
MKLSRKWPLASPSTKKSDRAIQLVGKAAVAAFFIAVFRTILPPAFFHKLVYGTFGLTIPHLIHLQ